MATSADRPVETLTPCGRRLLQERLEALGRAAMLLGLTLVNAPGASADVLISQPESRVCVGRPFTVGVWYQSYSGGPRRYRIDVYAPGGRPRAVPTGP